MKEFSKKEIELRKEIQAVYNSGHCDRALDMAKEFLIKFPDSLLAKYSYAVMSGDYASDLRHSEQERDNLLNVAKIGIAELYHNSSLAEYPDPFQKSVKNEYYWFHKMPEKQYQLGIEELSTDLESGHYSACVGASMVALKMISNGNIQEGEHWARESLQHFHEFEKLSPTWYNINYFGAQSEACLGHYEKSIEVYKAMYNKQNSEIKITKLMIFRGKY